MGSFNSSLFPQINALDFVQHSQTSFNPFVLNAPFLYPWKHLKTLVHWEQIGQKSIRFSKQPLCEEYLKTEFFLARIWTEFGEIRTKKNSLFRHFSKSEPFCYKV